MNLCEDYFSKNYFYDENLSEFFEKSNYNSKVLYFRRVFRRHHVGGNPMSNIDPSGLATNLICRAVGGSGGSAGGMHCFLRITPEAGSSLGSSPITLSLLTPDLKVGNKYINAPEDAGNGSFSAAVNNGKCNTSSGQDKIDKAIMASFNNQPNGTPYNPIPNPFQIGTNSNTFIHNVLNGAGLEAIPGAPAGAIGW